MHKLFQVLDSFSYFSLTKKQKRDCKFIILQLTKQSVHQFYFSKFCNLRNYRLQQLLQTIEVGAHKHDGFLQKIVAALFLSKPRIRGDVLPPQSAQSGRCHHYFKYTPPKVTPKSKLNVGQLIVTTYLNIFNIKSISTTRLLHVTAGNSCL